MSQVKGTGLCRGSDLTPAMVDGAILAKSALSHYDAGMLLGPARAETWRIEEKWNTAADHLTARLKPDHFTWHEATNLWSSISKTDGWHVELTDGNKTKMARWLVDAAEFVYVPYLLILALGDHRRDGDIVSDVATEKIAVEYLGQQMENIGPTHKIRRFHKQPRRRDPKAHSGLLRRKASRKSLRRRQAERRYRRPGE